MKIIIAAVLILGIYSCKNNAAYMETHFTPLRGQFIDSMKIPDVDDQLNKSFFSVCVIADSFGRDGVYRVNTTSGANNAEGMFTMPKGAEKFKPLVRKKNVPNTFIIGFHIPNDTTFYEYYELSSSHNTITMKYVKSYTFE